MSDPKSELKNDQPDSIRRRLTKGGLAAPVVLATLASKPVLGAVPWTCTISGQLSGNTSGHESETCTAVGKSHSVLLAEYFSSPETLVDKFPGLTNYFFVQAGVVVNVADGTGLTAATIKQILDPSASGLGHAQKAVVLLLNAWHLTDTVNYPLIESQARMVYESVANPAHPAFNDTDPVVSWNYDQVKQYIDVLYH